MRAKAAGLAFLIAGCVVGGVVAVEMSATPQGNQPNQPVIPIEGLDPVMLAQGKEVQGKESISFVRGRFMYIFANEQNRAAFEKNPEQYEIGEYCQVMGAPVTGNPDLHATHNGRTYLFGSDNCFKSFKAAPGDYLEPPLPAWKPSAAERARGQQVLEKLAAAMGGAAVLDGMISYREKRTWKSRRRDGAEFDSSTEVTQVFPNDLREVQVRRFGTIVTAFSGDTGFIQFQGRGAADVREPAPDARSILEETLLTDPVFFMRARKAPKFEFAAGALAEGLETVELRAGKIRITAAIDASTGRLVSLTRVGRGPDGRFGAVVTRFSDYRDAGGLHLPHRVDVTFNGEPWSESSYSVAEVEINRPVDPALFRRPKVSQR